jgi:predicted transposase YbfD/YdcC
MTSDQCHPGEPVFASLAMIGRIETEGERNGKIEQETRHYRSIALRALTFAGVVRAHWGVENRLHGVLDVIFREDLACFRTGHGPQNMAIIRHGRGGTSITWKPSSARPPDVPISRRTRLATKLATFFQGQPPSRGRHREPCHGRSAEGRECFLVCREPAGRLLRIGEPAVHRDLEDTTAGPTQADLRGRLGLQDRVPRRTGARFIASHSAVFDFDLHQGVSPGLWTPVPGWQEIALWGSPRRTP